MPEIKTIPTTTTLSVLNNVIEIITRYDATADDLPAIIQAFLADTPGILEGVSYVEGDLVVQFKPDTFPGITSISINANGELIIVGDDAANYSINANGELEYTN